MPIYAYRCSACQHTQDVLQKLGDPLLTQCPVCHAETFQKQVTAAGFQLKGSGWYVTDFKNNGNNGNSGKANGSATKPDPATGGGSTEGQASATPPAANAAGCGTGCACHAAA